MKTETGHPAVTLLFFVCIIFCAAFFSHPVYIVISFASAFVYSVVLKGRRAFSRGLCLSAGCVLLGFVYGLYHHFGVTVLIGASANALTLEALQAGLSLWGRIGAVLLWLYDMNTVMTKDKVVYLFGKISPRLSLYVSILLRLAPQIREKKRHIKEAQEGIGKGARQGTLFARVRNAGQLPSAITSWAFDHGMEEAMSMKSRGYGLKGRTAFSLYRFDHRDRTLVIVMATLMSLVLMAALFDQTKALYQPSFSAVPVTSFSFVFYAAYAALCLSPCLVDTSVRGFYTQKSVGK